MKNPEISVIMPTFNRAQLIGRAIESVLNQTFEDFELVIVDDGSTDNTEEIVRGINDPRIAFVKLQCNKGASHARNCGIEMAKAGLIAFQDSDDEWLPDKLQKQYDLLSASGKNVALVYTAFRLISNDDKKLMLSKKNRKTEGDLYKQILRGNFITSHILVKKECLESVGGYDETLISRHDWDLWIRLAKKWHFKYIPTPLVNVYHTEDSITVTKKVDVTGWKPIIEKYIHEFEKYPAILANHYMRIATWSVPTCKEDFYQRRKYMVKAIKTFPFVNYKYLILFLISLLGPSIYIPIRKKVG